MATIPTRALALAFARLPPDARQRGDWTCAMDDLLIMRWLRCALCGAAPLVFAHIWDPQNGSPTPAVCLGLCASCRAKGEATYTEDLARLFSQRYAGGRYGTKTDE